MARCPSCDDALSGTEHDGVHLALCNECGATWASLVEVEELHGGPVQTELLPGKTRHRCAVCRLTMSRARLDDRLDVEVCESCRGVFFAAGALSRFKPLNLVFKPSAMAGMFTCVTCGGAFPRSQGTARGAGLACRKCGGLDGETQGYEGKDITDAAVDWVRDNPTKPFIWINQALWVLTAVFFLLLAYCGYAR